jgi:hypothetical protein
MYVKGDGVPKDTVLAHAWWNLAGANGFQNAKSFLIILERNMTTEQKADAMKIARELFQRFPKKQ